MTSKALESLDEREKALIKEMPDDRRQMLRDEIGLLMIRERRLMGDLDRLKSSEKLANVVIKCGGNPFDMVLRTHAELTAISAQMLRTIVFLHLMDAGMDCTGCVEWRGILGDADGE